MWWTDFLLLDAQREVTAVSEFGRAAFKQENTHKSLVIRTKINVYRKQESQKNQKMMYF